VGLLALNAQKITGSRDPGDARFSRKKLLGSCQYYPCEAASTPAKFNLI